MTYEEIEYRLKEQLGEISANDQYHYELLLDSWKTYLRAGEDIAKSGLTIDTGKRLFVNPAVNVRNEAHKQILKLYRLFGIEPIARGDVTEKDDDELDKLIEG